MEVKPTKGKVTDFTFKNKLKQATSWLRPWHVLNRKKNACSFSPKWPKVVSRGKRSLWVTSEHLLSSPAGEPKITVSRGNKYVRTVRREPWKKKLMLQRGQQSHGRRLCGGRGRGSAVSSGYSSSPAGRRILHLRLKWKHTYCGWKTHVQIWHTRVQICFFFFCNIPHSWNIY